MASTLINLFAALVTCLLLFQTTLSLDTEQQTSLAPSDQVSSADHVLPNLVNHAHQPLVATKPPPPPNVCRQDRFPPMQKGRFSVVACVRCYLFLFQNGKNYLPRHPYLDELVAFNVSLHGKSSMPRVVSPTFQDPDSLEEICRWSLTDQECFRWKTCCGNAHKCCQQQIARDSPVPKLGKRQTPGCPATWDGYSCWPATSGQVTATNQCPSFVQHSISTRLAVKKCTANGNWSLKNGVVWTDYTACLDTHSYLIGVYICLACSGVSVVLLLPAIAIFLSFRDLCKQRRVRIHVNFFAALTFQGLCSIAWYSFVHFDMFQTGASNQTVMYLNPIWCRLLSVLKIYFTSATYFWMFCEGYFLHQLLANAFQQPRSLLALYLLGWGTPLLPSLVYAVLRTFISDEKCWAISIGAYEWIVYVPNLICIVINMIFLSNILRILIFQMHSHPHEPNNFRKGLKAAFMLIPLFGVQLVLTIYRIQPGSYFERQYEYITFIINSSQGICVSLIFCFFNGEVVALVRNLVPCSNRENLYALSQTQVSSVGDNYSPYANNDNASKNKRNLVTHSNGNATKKTEYLALKTNS